MRWLPPMTNTALATARPSPWPGSSRRRSSRARPCCWWCTASPPCSTRRPFCGWRRGSGWRSVPSCWLCCWSASRVLSFARPTAWPSRRTCCTTAPICCSTVACCWRWCWRGRAGIGQMACLPCWSVCSCCGAPSISATSRCKRC